MSYRFFILLITLFSFTIISSAQITKAARQYVEFIAIPNIQDWNYKPGEEAMVELSAYAGGIPLNHIQVEFEAGNEKMPSDMQGESIFENGKTTIHIGTMSQPGFRTCSVRFLYEGKTYTKQLKVGFSPEHIQPTVEMPDDFSDFWEAAIKEASEIPALPETTYMPQFSTEKVDVYLVKLQCYQEGNYIYGYLSKPKGSGRFPALMVPPGAGIKTMQPLTLYAERGFITLSIEVHGLSPLADKEEVAALNASIGEYMYSGLGHPSDYYYKKIYLGCIRAIDYLYSLPEFDGVNIGVCGGSQGGALAMVTAALDGRVKFVSAFYPALSDMTGFLHNRAGGWPGIFAPAKLSQLPVDLETAVKTLSYYDVVNFARLIRIPGFYSYGYNDNTCPPTSVCAAINSVIAPKEIVVTPTSAHWRFDETNDKSIEWMKDQCRVNEDSE